MAHALSGIPKSEGHKAALSASVKAAKARPLYRWEKIIDNTWADEVTFRMFVPGGQVIRHRTGGGCDPNWYETMCFVPGRGDW